MTCMNDVIGPFRFPANVRSDREKISHVRILVCRFFAANPDRESLAVPYLPAIYQDGRGQIIHTPVLFARRIRDEGGALWLVTGSPVVSTVCSFFAKYREEEAAQVFVDQYVEEDLSIASLPASVPSNWR